MRYLLMIALACSGCTMTRFPVNGKYATRISVFQKVNFSVTDTNGLTLKYDNDGGDQAVQRIVETAIKSAITAAK